MLSLGRFFWAGVLIATGVCWLWCSWHVWPGNGYTPASTPRWELGLLSLAGVVAGTVNLVLAWRKSALTWTRALLLGWTAMFVAAWVMVGHWPAELWIQPMVFGGETVVLPSDEQVFPHQCLCVLGALQVGWALAMSTSFTRVAVDAASHKSIDREVKTTVSHMNKGC